MSEFQIPNSEFLTVQTHSKSSGRECKPVKPRHARTLYPQRILTSFPACAGPLRHSRYRASVTSDGQAPGVRRETTSISSAEMTVIGTTGSIPPTRAP